MIIEAREDTITLRGSLKSNIWAAIQAAAALLLENHPKGIIIDCTLLTHISPKGAETFADAFKYIQEYDARIVLAGLSEEMIEIGKEVPGVRSQLSMASTVEEARSSIKLEEIVPERGRAKMAAVVPMLGNWSRAVYIADRLAMGENCEVHLVDLIKVPRSLPIGTPLPERESEGQLCLEMAKDEVQETRLQCFAHVERVRTNSSGLIDFTHQLDADFSVVSIDKGNRSDAEIDSFEAINMIESVNFELSLVKSSPKEHNKPIIHTIVPAVGEWEHAAEHACKLVMGQSDAKVTVVYSIVIPRTESIDTPKPEQEAAASNSEKHALHLAKKYGLNIDVRIERVRDPVLGFTKLIDPADFDAVVVGIGNKMSSDESVARAIAESLVDKPQCETILLKIAG